MATHGDSDPSALPTSATDARSADDLGDPRTAEPADSHPPRAEDDLGGMRTSLLQAIDDLEQQVRTLSLQNGLALQPASFDTIAPIEHASPDVAHLVTLVREAQRDAMDKAEAAATWRARAEMLALRLRALHPDADSAQFEPAEGDEQHDSDDLQALVGSALVLREENYGPEARAILRTVKQDDLQPALIQTVDRLIKMIQDLQAVQARAMAEAGTWQGRAEVLDSEVTTLQERLQAATAQPATSPSGQSATAPSAQSAFVPTAQPATSPAAQSGSWQIGLTDALLNEMAQTRKTVVEQANLLATRAQQLANAQSEAMRHLDTANALQESLQQAESRADDLAQQVEHLRAQLSRSEAHLEERQKRRGWWPF